MLFFLNKTELLLLVLESFKFNFIQGTGVFFLIVVLFLFFIIFLFCSFFCLFLVGTRFVLLRCFFLNFLSFSFFFLFVVVVFVLVFLFLGFRRESGECENEFRRLLLRFFFAFRLFSGLYLDNLVNGEWNKNRCSLLPGCHSHSATVLVLRFTWLELSWIKSEHSVGSQLVTLTAAAKSVCSGCDFAWKTLLPTSHFRVSERIIGFRLLLDTSSVALALILQLSLFFNLVDIFCLYFFLFFTDNWNFSNCPNRTIDFFLKRIVGLVFNLDFTDRVSS